jgi:hypothetical protein
LPPKTLTLAEQIRAAWQTIAMQNAPQVSPVTTVLAQLADRRRQETLQLKQVQEDEARAIAHCEKVATAWPVLFGLIQAEVDTANAQLRLHKQEVQFAFAELPVREGDQIAVCGFTIGDVRLTLSVCAYSGNIGLAHFKGGKETYAVRHVYTDVFTLDGAQVQNMSALLMRSAFNLPEPPPVLSYSEEKRRRRVA